MSDKNEKKQSKKSDSSKSGVFDALTNQNYYCEGPFVTTPTSALEKLAGSSLYLGDISKTHKEISLISFSKKELSDTEKKQRLILAVEKKGAGDEEKYYIKTGLYAGRITYNGVTFDIQPDCNDALYKHMLRYANHIYLDESDELGKENKNNSFPLIEYLFLSSLQRVSVLGLPQEYSKQRYHDLKVHGGLDIQNFIKKDIPFKGKISSQKNERHYVQCIVDVLYAAMKACKGEIEREFRGLSLIKNELSSSYSGKFPSQQTIQNAQSHRSLHNPMYADFKRTLTFAEIVIRRNTVLPDKSKDAKNKASGYLLDIASLWEVYLEHVLREGLNEWDVSAQEELNLYNGCFFKRPNYPDLVLRKKDAPSKVVVLDAKFKKMRLENEDVDRNDLHQIHSYAGYYREREDTVVLCGLIYPLSEEPVQNEEPDKNKKKPYGQLYGLDKPETLFVIDGIYKGKKSKQENSQKTYDNAAESAEDENSVISEELDKEYSYVKAEEAFVKRMQEYLK